MARLLNKLRFRKGDPHRDLYVPAAERLIEDTGEESDAQGPESEQSGDFDREEVRQLGEVVPQEELE